MPHHLPTRFRIKCVDDVKAVFLEPTFRLRLKSSEKEAFALFAELQNLNKRLHHPSALWFAKPYLEGIEFP